MRFVGFNFNKISVERLSNKLEKIKINTKIDISKIEPLKTNIFDKKEEIISVEFTYNIDYYPNFAKIEFAGDVLISAESKTIKKILKDWKDKKMDEDFRMFLFNIILRKSNLKALQLEDDMNLPIHLPFPLLKREEKKQ